jgi:hypothetical protein
MSRLLLTQVLLLLFACTIYGLIVVEPTKTEPNFEAGLIYVQGASIPTKNYMNFANNLQDEFDGRLWIALVDFPFNIPE